ncbi:MAG TPA: MarR family transcriptional regulator [Propionibacteriaceae bacterium]
MTPDSGDPSLGVLLFLPYRRLEQQVIEAVWAAGYAITLTQARLFQRVDAAGTRLTRLAESAQVTKQTAGVLVDELVRGGYVERVPDPSDGRARLITITARGYAVVAVATDRQREIEAEWRRHLGPRASSQLERALLALREITDPYA